MECNKANLLKAILLMFDVSSRAAESESRPELESAGVDRFGRSRSWSRQNFADSDSGPELQDTDRQQTMFLAERLPMLRLKKKK